MREIAGDDYEPDMPDPGTAAYLIEHFWSVGPTSGETAITSTELRDYQANMGIELTPWECKTLRQLSVEYINETHRATKDCAPPWDEAADVFIKLKRAAMKRKLQTFLST